MPVVTVNVISEGPGVRFNPFGVDGLVLPDAQLISTDANAIGMQDGQTIAVYGLAYGDSDGLFASTTDDGNLFVAESGRIAGGTNGVRFDAVSGFAAIGRLINNGEIVGIEDDGIEGAGSACVIINNGNISGSYGICYFSLTSDSVEIVNNGTITSSRDEAFGIALGVNSGGVIRNHGTITNGIEYSSVSSGYLLENTGTISADSAGGAVIGSGEAQGDTIINSGTISGLVDTAGGADVVRNSGSILGDVALGAGADLYRSGAHGLVEGSVTGLDGGDTLTGGSGDDTLSGDAGTISCSARPATTC